MKVNQEWIALGVVTLTMSILTLRFYRVFLVAPLSQWMLNLGYVKLAMFLRKQVKAKSGCSSCKA